MISGQKKEEGNGHKDADDDDVHLKDVRPAFLSLKMI